MYFKIIAIAYAVKMFFVILTVVIVCWNIVTTLINIVNQGSVHHP
jgi:hypothetical protein